MRCLNAQCSHKQYYIAAVEEEWDYAPSGKDLIQDLDFSLSPPEVQLTTVRTRRRIGRAYTKALYREYTDDTFTTLSIREPWLGLLGPVIRAEVGDIVEILFLNNATIPYSIHPHGVFYTKDSEGAWHTNATEGSSVDPGQTFPYTWRVPERAGPGEGDPSSILWLYHSHRSEVNDTNSGLIGPTLIYRQGSLDPETQVAKDVTTELILLFSLFDERSSQYYAQNSHRVLHAREEEGEAAKNPEIWADMMQAINGYVYGNLPGLTVNLGDRVRWHVSAMGSELDLHTATWNGLTLLDHGHRVDEVSLLPGTFKTVDSQPDVPGRWLISCSVHDHLVGGMAAWVHVTEHQNQELWQNGGSPSQTGLLAPSKQVTLGDVGVFGWFFILATIGWWTFGMIRLRRMMT